MDKTYAISLGLSLFGAMAFLLFASFLISLGGYRKRKESRYSFLTLFPFELVEGDDPFSKYGKWGFCCYALADVVLAGYPLYTLGFHVEALSLAIVCLVFAFLRDVAWVLLLLVPAYSFKPHMISVTLFAMMTAIFSAFSGITFLYFRAYAPELGTGFALVCFVLSAASLGLAVNPRLSNWTKLASVIDEDGNTVLSRPKPFVLAFTEWLLFLLGVVSSVVMLFGITIINVMV